MNLRIPLFRARIMREQCGSNTGYGTLAFRQFPAGPAFCSRLAGTPSISGIIHSPSSLDCYPLSGDGPLSHANDQWHDCGIRTTFQSHNDTGVVHLTIAAILTGTAVHVSSDSDTVTSDQRRSG